MVALVANVVQSFRSLLSLLPPIIQLKTSLATNIGHHLNLPLPPVIHQTLGKEFIDRFEEIVVIGDVHGCYDELIQLLDQIHHNHNKPNDNNDTNNNSQRNGSVGDSDSRILKLFVGDLVNKGPKSGQVLDYLLANRETCLSVRGNHDEVVIREYLRYEREGESTLADKNRWMTGLSRKQIDYLISMPYTISIPSLNTLIVHAGLEPNRPLMDQTMKNMTGMRNVYTSDDDNRQLLATNKDTVGEPWINRWSGPEHVYFGHDAKRALQRTPFATGLDTGCVYGKSLTALFINGRRTDTYVTVKATAVHCEPNIKPKPSPPEPQIDQ